MDRPVKRVGDVLPKDMTTGAQSREAKHRDRHSSAVVDEPYYGGGAVPCPRGAGASKEAGTGSSQGADSGVSRLAGLRTKPRASHVASLVRLD